MPSPSPEKRRAQARVQRAVRRGELVRPEQCEGCGQVPPRDRDGRSSIVADHVDYSKPLEVQWLCRECHTEAHLERGDAVVRKEPDGKMVWTLYADADARRARRS
jgi:hypothetical protein